MNYLHLGLFIIWSRAALLEYYKKAQFSAFSFLKGNVWGHLILGITFKIWCLLLFILDSFFMSNFLVKTLYFLIFSLLWLTITVFIRVGISFLKYITALWLVLPMPQNLLHNNTNNVYLYISTGYPKQMVNHNQLSLDSW